MQICHILLLRSLTEVPLIYTRPSDTLFFFLSFCFDMGWPKLAETGRNLSRDEARGDLSFLFFIYRQNPWNLSSFFEDNWDVNFLPYFIVPWKPWAITYLGSWTRNEIGVEQCQVIPFQRGYPAPAGSCPAVTREGAAQAVAETCGAAHVKGRHKWAQVVLLCL